jgi:hypothetical protein
MRAPARITALIIQNGDIYEDVLGPKYEFLIEYFRKPTAKARAKLVEAVSEEGFRDEFVNDVHGELAERIPPDLWKLHWSLMTPKRRDIAVTPWKGSGKISNGFRDTKPICASIDRLR